MRSRTLAELEKKMVSRLRATRKALAQDGESLRHLVNQIKLLKVKVYNGKFLGRNRDLMLIEYCSQFTKRTNTPFKEP